MTKSAAAVLARVAIGVGLAALVLLGARAREGPEPTRVKAEFARAGLNVRPGYEVRVRGIPVGTVESVHIDRSDFSATYTLAIDRAQPVARATKAELVPKTVFGDKYVALEPAAAGQPRLRDGDTIPRSRTSAGTEVQKVIDRVVPVLRAIEPERFGAALASFGEGFAGSADALGRMADGGTAAMNEFVAREPALGTLLDHAPGVAGTVAERADDLATAATQLGRVAQTIGENEPALARLLSENAELATQVADLLDDRPGRLGQIIPDMVDVVSVTASQPGRVAKFAQYFRWNIRGTANIFKSGWVRIRESETIVMNPGTWADAPAPYGEFDGGTGIFPDIYLHGLPNQNVTIPPEEEQQTPMLAPAGNG